MGKSQDAVVVVVLKILQASCISFEVLWLIGLSGVGDGNFCLLSTKSPGYPACGNFPNTFTPWRVPSAHVWLLWCPGAEVLDGGCAQVVFEGTSEGVLIFSLQRMSPPSPPTALAGRVVAVDVVCNSAAPSVIKALLNLCLALCFLTGLSSEAKGLQFNSKHRWFVFWSWASGLERNQADPKPQGSWASCSKSCFQNAS